MKTIMEAFNLPPYYKTNGDLGIEIEVEGLNLPVIRSYWNEEYDGSLRGECKEFVLKKPSSLAGVVKALNHLDKAYIERGTEVFESVRAGVHVHVNVQKLTTVELFSFMTAYIIFEDLLVNFCGNIERAIYSVYVLRMQTIYSTP